MGAKKIALLFLLACVCFSFIQTWSGNVCTTTKVRYETRSECRSQFLWWCPVNVTVTYPVYYTDNICCPGWRDNGGDQNCVIPICTPSCMNGGTCIGPNTCKCQVQNTSQFCDESVCSHLNPCYPGRCIPPNSCDCTSGFTTSSTMQNNCLTIEGIRNSDIKIHQMRVRMFYWPRGTTPASELYWIMADSTQKTDMDFFWFNQKDFNRLEVSCSSQFSMSDLPYKPDYIGNAGFGVVSGRVEVWLSKRPAYPSNERFSSLNNTFPCPQPDSKTQPVEDIYKCNLIITDFDQLLAHGDFLTITFLTEGGGFRDLLNLNNNPPTLYTTQTYDSINRSQSVQFRFDFQPPTHCGETNSCHSGETMLAVPDITKVAPLRISWTGWEDADSKMYRYSMEVFKMTRTTDDKLEIRVDRALQPLINGEVFASSYTSQEYTPPEPGEVLMYPKQLENGKKNIPRSGPLDDHEGQRTVDAIPNKRGILNFKLWYAKDHVGGKTQPPSPTIPPPADWIDLGLNTTFTLPAELRPSEADTVTVWVKATDAMGNERIERTRVTFDSTPPTAYDLKFYVNVPVPGVELSSVFDLTVRDRESGIAYVLWTFKGSNGTVIYQEKVPGKRADQQSCSLDFTKCDCTPAGDCFYFNQSYAVSNCHMMVEEDKLETEKITLSVDVTNIAGLVTSLNWTKQDITELNGTTAYFPSQNVNVSNITSDSAKLTWTVPPSCFPRTGLWAIVNDRKDPVPRNAIEYSITSLDPDTVYTVRMVTEYQGGQMSDSQTVTFKTVILATVASEGMSTASIIGTVLGSLGGTGTIAVVIKCTCLRRR